MEIKETLEKHSAWLKNEVRGVRADLRGANLRGADLSGANLSGANLSGANLRGADLSGANLSGANLSGAKLSWANLSGAKLSGANLSGANLSGANLHWADLSGANLHWADLSGANLSGANLSGANLDMSSGIPFHCGGTMFKGDDRLFAQMLFHLTRGNWDGCSGGVKEAVETIRAMAVTDLFCEYRNDVRPL